MRLLQVSGTRPQHKLVKAMVDCRAVSSEHLAFYKDEIIVVTATSDPHWWVSVTSTSGYSNAATCILVNEKTDIQNVYLHVVIVTLFCPDRSVTLRGTQAGAEAFLSIMYKNW